jgi:hypothetical protein
MRPSKRFWIALGSSAAVIGTAASITLGVLTLTGVTFHGGEAEGQSKESDFPSGFLRTGNRDRLSICIRAIGFQSQVQTEAEAKLGVERALVGVVRNPQWLLPVNKLAVNPPTIDTGCYLPSSVYEPVDPAYPPHSLLVIPRRVTTASNYRIVVFVVPEDEINRLTGGLPRDQSIRAAPEETMCEGELCSTVTTGLYLAPSELQDAAFLTDWLLKAIGLKKAE